MSTLIQRSFSGGEIAPALYARTDQSKYQTGARKVRNAFVMRHGGLASRPGSQVVGRSSTTGPARLIPFVFSQDVAFVLEFTEQKIAFIKNGAHIRDLSLSVTDITNASPPVVTYTGTDPSNGDIMEFTCTKSIGGAIPMSNFINGRRFKVANVNGGANTFEITELDGSALDSTAWGGYDIGSGVSCHRIYRISSPYDEDDLAEIRFVQSADVLTLAHPSYAPRELARVADDNWTLSTITFSPTQVAPTNLSDTGGAAGADLYKVTAVATETYEESLPTASYAAGVMATSGSPIVLSWTAAAGAVEYNVYKAKNGVYGFIGIAQGTSFTDNGLDPDTTDTPPVERTPFTGSGNYPTAVTYVQQRLGWGCTDNDPEKVELSRTNQFKNLTVSRPLQDDDAVNFTMAGRQVNAIQHMLDLAGLVIFTTAGEWTAGGNEAGIITPTQINLKPQSYNGSGILAPLVIDNTALYVQERGAIVRDLAFEVQADGYRGNDLTIFAAHLFDGYSIVDWAFQKVPHSVVWAVRSDGVLIALTYVREHQVLGWHRHDTDGEFENVCVIPEGGRDVLYAVVNRDNGRFVERFANRQITATTDIREYIGMDAAGEWDGRNTGATTMTLSGGSTWAYDETLTLTASSTLFSGRSFAAVDVGKQVHLYVVDADGEITDTIRFTIEAFSSGTVVTGKANKTVPASLRTTATLEWGFAIATIEGLWHLNGKTVSVFADGNVVASPNNESYGTVTVSNGEITLDDPAVLVRIGLPFNVDIETLDVDTAQGETIADKKKQVGAVTLQLESTRGVWVGGACPEEVARNTDDDPLHGLYELKLRETEGYDDSVDLFTGARTVPIRAEWNSNGRVFIRQVDPLPMSVLSVAPAGLFPFKG